MERYLRPETLFGNKFESYLNTVGVKVVKKEKSNEFNENDRPYNKEEAESVLLKDEELDDIKM